jgi:uncharacterized protein (TIGR00369 family)
MKLSPFNEYLGTRIENIGQGEAVACIDLQPHHRNRRGVAHGGVVSALLDSALGAAVISAIPKEWWCATISISIQFVAGGRGDRLTATGRFQRRGVRVAFASGEVRDDRGHLVATAEGSWHLWPHKPGTKRFSTLSPYVVMRGTGERIHVGKILAVGRNYAAHIAEMGGDEGAPPVIFFKPATSIVHDGGAVVLPADVGEVHHELELVVVIGRRAKRVDPSTALDHVLGYAAGLDMTLRDVQAEAKEKGGPWAIAKGFDSSAPVSLVAPAAEVGDGSGLTLNLYVNGECRQTGSTDRMIRPVSDLVALASRYVTLEPGDLLFTGTPEGVGPVRAGDVLRAEIDNVGAVGVRVVEEKA